MNKTDPNYCPFCGIHRFHASPGCVNHGQENPLADSHAKIALSPIDATQSDEYLLNQFTDEAVSAGYEHDPAVKIARGRIENLRSGGDGYSVGKHGEQQIALGRRSEDAAARPDSTGGTSQNVVDPQRASTTTAGEPTRALGDEFDSRR